MKEIQIPDIGSANDVEVIEILVAVGDTIEKEQSLITLETDKASMEIPSTDSGIVREIKLCVGDKVAEGDLILYLETADLDDSSTEIEKIADIEKTVVEKSIEMTQPSTPTAATNPVESRAQFQALPTNASSALVYAGPATRRFARELGVDLTRIKGTGVKNRITKEDVQGYVKAQIQKSQSGATGVGFTIDPLPVIDFSQFGAIEQTPLNKIKRLTAKHLHRNWVMIPHVTQFEEADITELEAFRREHKDEVAKRGFRLTPLIFIMKAVAMSLLEFPQFNASLSEDGNALIVKKYCHIGVAVDTPNGLVVAVIRDVDQKGVLALAEELGKQSEKARTVGLSLKEMQGGCFTISSLGGIGGTAFTPIVNWPEVAILGVSKSAYKPIYQAGEFVPRLMLPLSLSYDHRVIDGADAARFTTHLAQRLADIRLLVL